MASAIVPHLCGTAAARLLPQTSDPNGERGMSGSNVAMERTFSGHRTTLHPLHLFSLRVSMPHADAPRLDHAVKAFDEAGPSDFFERGDFAHAKKTLKYQDSLLQYFGTTVQIPPRWDSTNASIARSASMADAGLAPSDFVLTFLDDGDLRNPNYV